MEENKLLKKSIVLILIIFFIGVSICPLVENVQSCDCYPPCWPELGGKLGNNNWYVSTVNVFFIGSCDQVNYRINGGSWSIYTASFELIDEGINLLEWTCDGNISDIYSVEIKIDTI